MYGRNQFAMDLLKNGITVDDLENSFACKGELDDRDLDQIADTAAMIIAAVEKRKRIVKLTKQFANK